MWFKNILLYEMLEPLPDDAANLMAKLAKRAIRPTQKTESTTLGWTSPFGDDNRVFAHALAGCYLLKACKEIRILPPAVVQENLLKRIQEIEATDGRKVF